MIFPEHLILSALDFAENVLIITNVKTMTSNLAGQGETTLMRLTEGWLFIPKA
jgi:hypothetical protein